MPTIWMYGTPAEMTQDELGMLMNVVVDKTREVSGIDYERNEVMVWFPADRMELGLGNEFSIDVANLDSVAIEGIGRRTVGQSSKIAQQYCSLLASFFPDYWCIECGVRPFAGHEEGYYLSNREKSYYRSVDWLTSSRR